MFIPFFLIGFNPNYFHINFPKTETDFSLKDVFSPTSLTEKKNGLYLSWTTQNNLTTLADTFIELIRNCDQQGLNPHEYHLGEIDRIVHSSTKNKNVKKLSALLTDAFVLMATHHYAGRICSEKEGNIDWFKHVSEINSKDSLKKVFKDGGIKKMMSSFSCKHPQYLLLQNALVEYISIKKSGGWLKLPANFSVKKGDKNKKVLLLKKRLVMSNELKLFQTTESVIFDATLEESIKEFQYRHNQPITGKIDKAMILELNIPVEKRIKQIAFNMDRWRWLQRTLPDTYIMVNIAGFDLAVKQNNRELLTMRIIAGSTFHPTPLFHSEMNYIILNPGWDIPMSIARNEILPHLKSDNQYLIKNNIKMYESRKPDAAIINAEDIVWSDVSSKDFNFRLRQMSGTNNPLGNIKFMFPNSSYVYFHDTPFRDLFSKKSRAFSHGCMRIEKPIELAAFIMKKDTAWVANKLKDAIAKKREVKLITPSQIGVYICYWTIYVDENGKLCFENDAYLFDNRMEEFMNSKKCIPYFGSRIPVN
ncbi:MAG: L,D-transpeptidase family protein [Bacteroidota bacterium]